MAPTLNGLLLRFPAANTPSFTAAHSAARSQAGLELEPLFAVDAPATALGVSGPAQSRQWFLAQPKGSMAGATDWDIAHETHARLAAGINLASAAAPDIIEPDLIQRWPIAEHQPTSPFAAAAAEACVFTDQDPELPLCENQFAWHLRDNFSQLSRARQQAAQNGRSIRIAHLDTGYDPEHETFAAARMDLERQRNFVENNGDARDPGNSGTLRNPGHGTGTLSILAGGRFKFTANGYHFNDELGGVLHAKVVPVRVGNSVVQITTSSVAKGIGYAVALCASDATRIDVISMSMGGVASAAWADAVNQAYEAGIVYVAAAGNNFSAGVFGFPTHQIVFPARFRRVIAACGVMADRQPYYGLPVGTMQGNWGPATAMETALSAFTPNIAWARWGCGKIVRMDGAGTSSATPQIAAAAALYLQHHAAVLFDRDQYREPWMRVEAVRRALFGSADKTADNGSREKLGHGLLRAAEALKDRPAASQDLTKTPLDRAGFPFLNVLSSTALAPSPTEQMLQLEATQLIQQWDLEDVPNPLELAVDDPDQRNVPHNQVVQFLEALQAHPRASQTLKSRVKQVLDQQARPQTPSSHPPPPSPPPPQMPVPPETSAPSAPSSPAPQAARSTYVPPEPPYRKLRAYAVDPSLTTTLDTVGISELTFKVPWEKLAPGPVGEYLEVMDIDPASRCFYEPVDLDDPLLLAQDGLPPAEGVPQFHQQMVYAVSSLTIENFERALGRKALWRPRRAEGASPKDDSRFIPRLRIYPHALREANAYYSPDKIALLFGYFNAQSADPGLQMPGGRVFTCLSHDIVAHETTHALLDGMHRRFLLPTNPDVPAFHEGFADCVAMLQHFTFPELVKHQIATTRGGIDSQENLLVQLAAQFGQAIGKRTALRDAIGEEVNGVWQPRVPDPAEYQSTDEPHDRGRILVSAVFDAFLSIYKHRTADLMRLATGGTGVLRPGAIHPDLVNRLADEAAKSAQHVLTMCIRALDYCPPTDITFGEYLRAIITADYDIVADDDLNYRVSFVEAFRRRGIFPPGMRTLSPGSLLWRSPEDEDPKPSEQLLEQLGRLRDSGTIHLYAESREEIFRLQREMRILIHDWLEQHFRQHPDGPRDAAFLGLNPRRSFEVHMARIAYRTSPDGGTTPQLLIGLLQSTTQPISSDDRKGPRMAFEGGSTVVADLRSRKVRYCIRKSLNSASRLARQQQFALGEFDSLQATYLGARSLDENSALLAKEPFALIHRS